MMHHTYYYLLQRKGMHLCHRMEGDTRWTGSCPVRIPKKTTSGSFSSSRIPKKAISRRKFELQSLLVKCKFMQNNSQKLKPRHLGSTPIVADDHSTIEKEEVTAELSFTQPEFGPTRSYKEMLDREDWPEYQRAMDAYIERIRHSYEVVAQEDIPFTANIIRGRWIFDNSHEAKYDDATEDDKAVYATHNEQAHPSKLRANPFRTNKTLLTSVYKRMEKNAIRNGYYRGRITANSEYGRYCDQPEGYEVGIDNEPPENCVWKMATCVYCSKDAESSEIIEAIKKKLGTEVTSTDPNLYIVNVRGEGKVWVGIRADDAICWAPTKQIFDAMMQEVNGTYPIGGNREGPFPFAEEQQLEPTTPKKKESVHAENKTPATPTTDRGERAFAMRHAMYDEEDLPDLIPDSDEESSYESGWEDASGVLSESVEASDDEHQAFALKEEASSGGAARDGASGGAARHDDSGGAARRARLQTEIRAISRHLERFGVPRLDGDDVEGKEASAPATPERSAPPSHRNREDDLDKMTRKDLVELLRTQREEAAARFLAMRGEVAAARRTLDKVAVQLLDEQMGALNLHNQEEPVEPGSAQQQRRRRERAQGRNYQRLAFAADHGGVAKPEPGWNGATTRLVRTEGEACVVMNPAKGSLGRVHHPECKLLNDKHRPGLYKPNVYTVSLKWALKTRREFVSQHGCCYKRQQDPVWGVMRAEAYQELRAELAHD